MSRVASAANLMGVDVDQLNAQLSTIISVTRQAPETVGTALKSIYARISDIEAGIDTETTLGSYTKEMEQYGIRVLDANNKLRDMGEVIEEVGNKWSTMTREQQVGLSQAMAGTRQYVNLLALFNNWDKYTDALETSREAVGTLQRQQNTFLEGTQAKLKQLKATQEALYTSILKAEDINSLVEVFTNITKGATAFFETIGGGKNALIGLGAIITQVFGKHLSASITTAIINMQGLKDNAIKLNAQFEILQQFKGIKVPDDALMKLIEMKEQVIQYSKVVSAEQQNQANSLISVTNELHNQREAWNQTKLEAQQFYEQQTGKKIDFGALSDPTVLNNYQEGLRNIISSFSQIDQNATNFINRLNSLDTLFKEFQKTGNENLFNNVIDQIEGINKKIAEYETNITRLKNSGKASSESVRELEEALLRLRTAIKESEDALSSGDLNIAAVSDDRVQSAIRNLVSAYQKAGSQIRSEAKRTSETLASEARGATQEIESNIASVDASFQSMIKRWSLERSVQKFTQVASTIGQIAFAFNSLTNVLNTWKNKEASFGDKITQTLIFIGTTVPMLISAVGKLNKVFGTTNLLAGIYAGLQERNHILTNKTIALKIAENLQLSAGVANTEALIVALGQKIVAEKLDIATMTEEQILLRLKEIAQEKGIVLTEAETLAIIKQIKAENAHTRSLSLLTVLQNAFNASLLHNPIVLVVSALVLLTGTIIAYTKALQKSYEVEEKEANKRAELADEEKKEATQNKELYKTYNDLYYNYKKGIVAKKELEEGTNDLVESLKDEDLAVEKLLGDYDALNKKILENRTKDIREELKQAEQGVQAKKESLTAKVKKEDFGTITEEGQAQILFDYGWTSMGDLKSQEFFDSKIFKDWAEEYNEVLTEGSQISALNPYNYITNAMGFAVDFDPQDIKSFLETYDALNELVKQTQISGTTRELESDMFTQIKEWVSTFSESAEDLRKRQEELNSLIGEFEVLKSDIFEVSNYEDFKTAREEIKERLKIRSDEYKDYDDNELNNIINQYIQDTTNLADGYIMRSNVIDQISKELELKKDKVESKLSSFSDEDLSLIVDLELNKEDFMSNLDETLRDAKREIESNKISEGLELSRTLIPDIQSGKISYENVMENEDYNDFIEILKDLEKEHSDLSASVQVLNNNWITGTQEYIEALENVRNKLSKIKLENLVEDTEEAGEKLQDFLDGIESQEIDMTLVANKEEFEDTLQQFLDADYQVNIEIHTQAEDEFDSIVSAMDDIYDKASMIGENFIVAANDIRELNNTFPGIIEGLEFVGDGTVRLNQQIVESAINGARAEVAADVESTVSKLENQAKLLRSKEQTYREMAAAAARLAHSEILSEDQAADEKAIISEGISKLLGHNDQATTDLQLDNNELVANESSEASAFIANEFTKGYQKAATASAEWARTNLANMKAAIGEGSIIEGAFGDTQYKGATFQSKEAKELENIQNSLDSGKNLGKDYYAQLEAYLSEAANSYGAMANDVEGMIAEVGARTVELDEGFKNISAGKGVSPKDKKEKGSKEKEEKVKDPDVIEFLEDEADRYHDINLQLEKLETNLDRLEDQQKKLYGKDLIDSLNKQLDILNKQKDAYRVKLEIAKAEQAELRKTLEAGGATFDTEGYISNYASVLQSKLDYVNSVIAQYNSMTAEEQEGFKDTVETAKEEYNTFKDQIDRYDELISSFIPDIEDSIQDATDKQIEININKFTMEVELRLDMAAAERDFNEFKRKVIDEIKDDDILGNAKSKVKDYLSYYDTNESGYGSIQKLTEQINDTMNQVRQMENTGWADFYGDNKDQAMEDLEKYYEELIGQLEDIVDLVDEIKQSYLDMIDEAVDAFDKQVDQYEYIKDLLNHDMNVIGLVYGDKAYSQMAKYYEQIEDNNNQELDFLKKRVAYAEEMMNKETDPKAREKWEEEWMKSLEKLNSKVEESIQNIIDKYANAVNLTFDKLNKKVTSGKGLDYVNDEWDLINKNADQYLDTINSLYGIQELENKYLEAINNTDNISSQKKLNDLMNEQLELLRDKDKLTQYDVDRANMLYEIALKEIALEEAQQNKSQMRLRRDSQGNYTYQFVSDEDEVAQAQQDLLLAQKDLYNFDKQNYKENLDEIYGYYVEFQEKYKEIMLDMSLTDEEKQERTKLLTEQYGELINGLVEQNETIKQNLHESTFFALEGLYKADSESFKEMTGKDIEAFRDLTDAEKDLIIGELIPQWNSGVQNMVDTFAGEGGLIPVCKDAFEELDETTKDYQDSLDELESAAGIDFDNIASGYDENIEKAQDLLYANDDLINKYMEEIDAILEVISQLDDLIFKYKEVHDAAIEAAEAAYKFVTAQKEAAAEAARETVSEGGFSKPPIEEEDTSPVSPIEDISPVITPEPEPPIEEKKEDEGNGIPEVGDVVTYTGGLYYYDSYGTNPSGSRGKGKKVTITYLNPKAPYPIHVESTDSAYGWLKKDQISGYDTGGYTGDWNNDDGKLAILHKKELVLKDTDTENLLSAVEVVRNISDILDNLDNNFMNRISNLLPNFNMFDNMPDFQRQEVDQNVHIDANFPNVKNSSEIEDALNNLVNIASMRAFKNIR